MAWKVSVFNNGVEVNSRELTTKEQIVMEHLLGPNVNKFVQIFNSTLNAYLADAEKTMAEDSYAALEARNIVISETMQTNIGIKFSIMKTWYDHPDYSTNG